MNLLSAALGYARKKYPVFPVRNKVPLVARGFLDASADLELTRQRFEVLFPNATGIGMPCGTASGIVILDIDPRNGGDKSLAVLQEEYGPLPQTLIAKTGGGGLHLYFYTRGKAYKKTVIAPGLDFLAEGCYAVVPPSLHASGGQYEWENSQQAISELPEWLDALLTKGKSNGAGPAAEPQKIREGQRNGHLTSLAGSMRRRGMSQDAIELALLKENEERCEPPLEEKEVRNIAKSVSKYAPSEEPQGIPGRYPVTETANGERLAARFKDELRYCSDRRVWAAYEGTHWKLPDPMGVERRMQAVAKDVYSEAARESSEELRKKLAAWAIRSESQSVIENSIDAARSMLEVEYAKLFDRNPLLLNAGMTINLKTGTAHEHRREDYLTNLIEISWNPKAKCPGFLEFLNQTFGGSPSLVGYITRLAGYFLTGLTTEQKFWGFFGPTASGKSTLIKILHGIMGPYAHKLPENFFLQTNETDWSTGQLPGVRLATCVETTEARRLNVSRIKTITGEDSISAQLKYQNYFEFQPQCKLVLVTNHPPRVPASDDALWRRFRVLDFNRAVPEEKRTPDLAAKLLAEEAPGILAWAVQGCLEWQEKGLMEPEIVRLASADYRTSQDTVADFIAERYCFEMDARASKKAVVKDFADYCDENGLKKWTTTKLSQELRRLGITISDDKRYYEGIR